MGKVKTKKSKDTRKEFEKLLAKIPEDRREVIEEMFWGEEGLWDRFSTSPASTRYHDSKEGGLLKHSLNVTYAMLKTNKALDLGIDEDSIVICGLLHDLGKIGSETEAMYIPKNDGYVFNTNIAKLPHALWSTFILQEFGLILTEDEYQAIIFHNGFYTPMGAEIKNSETRLQWLLHICDVQVTRK